MQVDSINPRANLRTFAVAIVTLAALGCGTVQAQSDAWQKLERIDVQPNGTPTATQSAIKNPTISDDGRWVIFTSAASDLVPGDTNGKRDMFVRDRRSNTTRRVNLHSDGTQFQFDIETLSASSNGRFITFITFEYSLVPNDTNYDDDAFLLDRDSDGNGVFDEAGGTSLEVVSVNSSNTTFYNGVKLVAGAVSDNAKSVVFATLFPIVGNDTNSYTDVYVRDRPSASSRLMSQSIAGTPGNGDSPDFFRPPLRMSDDGAIVAFSSEASNLVAGDTNGATDIFVRNRDSDGNGVFDEPGGSTIVLAGTGPGGSGAPFANFDLSGDGRWLAIAASNPAGANPTGTDIYVHDLLTGTDAPIPFSAAAWNKSSPSCCGNQRPLISRAGEVVAFTSGQRYVFDNVSYGRNDVFVQAHGRPLTRITDFAVPLSATDGLNYAAVAMSRNGAYLLIASNSTATVAPAQAGTYVYQRDQMFSGSFD